ncbi:MAG: flagellar biosynthetic protein FliQ [Bdellovibrionales bacterium]|nr:flagellar biosynthetic protein FliQ [Bdellovibrionales bacterium]
MDLDFFIRVATYGVQTAMLVSLPVLGLGLIAGVAVSIMQAATQINDAALAFIPKIAAAVFALLIFGPWMMSELVTFTTFSFNQIPLVTGP